MGTSNWQHIPYCIEVLKAISPDRVFDVGVGYGRWGMIIREFCDVWAGRVLRKNWAVHIEGVEGFEPNISDYHQYFYNKIHIGDFNGIYKNLQGRWNLILFGDVLEHFPKENATALLAWALDSADYVLVNIPLGKDWEQDDMYDNTFEIHRSEWSAEEFSKLHMIRSEMFADFTGRPFGSFVLSKNDPKNLSHKLFSFNTEAAPSAGFERQSPDSVELTKLKNENYYLRQKTAAIEASAAVKILRRVAQIPVAGAILKTFKK